ncbi:hypothetical protein ABPG74_002113 [Tetrahymena malaccensis]
MSDSFYRQNLNEFCDQNTIFFTQSQISQEKMTEDSFQDKDLDIKCGFINQEEIQKTFQIHTQSQQCSQQQQQQHQKFYQYPFYLKSYLELKNCDQQQGQKKNNNNIYNECNQQNPQYFPQNKQNFQNLNSQQIEQQQQYQQHQTYNQQQLNTFYELENDDDQQQDYKSYNSNIYNQLNQQNLQFYPQNKQNFQNLNSQQYEQQQCQQHQTYNQQQLNTLYELENDDDQQQQDYKSYNNNIYNQLNQQNLQFYPQNKQNFQNLNSQQYEQQLQYQQHQTQNQQQQNKFFELENGDQQQGQKSNNIKFYDEFQQQTLYYSLQNEKEFQNCNPQQQDQYQQTKYEQKMIQNQNQIGENKLLMMEYQNQNSFTSKNVDQIQDLNYDTLEYHLKNDQLIQNIQISSILSSQSQIFENMCSPNTKNGMLYQDNQHKDCNKSLQNEEEIKKGKSQQKRPKIKNLTQEQSKQRSFNFQCKIEAYLKQNNILLQTPSEYDQLDLNHKQQLRNINYEYFQKLQQNQQPQGSVNCFCGFSFKKSGIYDHIQKIHKFAPYMWLWKIEYTFNPKNEN